jgi:hypothetical protein
MSEHKNEHAVIQEKIKNFGSIEGFSAVIVKDGVNNDFHLIGATRQIAVKVGSPTLTETFLFHTGQILVSNEKGLTCSPIINHGAAADDYFNKIKKFFMKP